MKLSNSCLVAVVIVASTEGFDIQRIPRLSTYDSGWQFRHSSCRLQSKPEGDDDDSTIGILINKLDDRGIEFSPSASKEELRELLRQDDYSSSYSFGSGRVDTRQGRRERRRPSRQRYVDDYYNDIYMEDEDELGNLPPREQRRRRRKAGTRVLGNYMTDGIPEKVVRVGAQATKIAKSKTKQAWKSLMELTYDDELDDFEAPRPQPRSASPSRPTRPSSRYETQRRTSSHRRPEPNGASYRPPPRHEQSRDKEGLFRKPDPPAGVESIVQDDKPISTATFSTPSPPDANYRPPPRHAQFRDEKEPFRKLDPPAGTEDLLEDGKTKTGTTFSSDASTPAAAPKRRISDILKELDDSGISYSPGASRKDLEYSLSIHYEQTRTAPSPPPDVSSAFLYVDEKDDEEASWKDLWETTSKAASKKAKSIPRRIVTKAETARQKARDIASILKDSSKSSIPEEKDIILDAVIEEFSRDQAIHEERVVEAEPVSPEEWSAKARAAPPRPRASTAQPRRRRQRPAPRRPRRAMYEGSMPPYPNYNIGDDRMDVSNDIIFRLPPAEAPANTRTRSRRQRQRDVDTEPRRVYSPYNTGEEDDPYGYFDDLEGVYKDGVENMGHFMANAVDSFLWGRDSRRYRPQPKRRVHKRTGHWKDRMEENFDQFMGIHEDGKYYDRWANQDSKEKDKAEGTDAVSYARGRSKKRRGRQVQKKAVWEEDGSLLSVLFGTGEDARRRNSNLYHSSSSRGMGGGGASLLRLTRSVIQSGTMVAGSLGRWASVRGSLPQPVIMVSIIASALSARPGRRIQTIVLATLALRMLGELLHGYMYDDLDFADDYEDDCEDDLEDDPLSREYELQKDDNLDGTKSSEKDDDF